MNKGRRIDNENHQQTDRKYSPYLPSYQNVIDEAISSSDYQDDDVVSSRHTLLHRKFQYFAKK